MTDITGTGERDRLFGTVGSDIIDAGDGDDDVYGNAGDDLIYAGAGADYVEGGEGDDEIFGLFGNDTIQTGAGADYVAAGDGNDLILSGGGSDEIYAEEGHDTIFVGGDASDRVLADAGEGQDIVRIFGLYGGDFDIRMGSGADRVVVHSLTGRATLSFGPNSGSLQGDTLQFDGTFANNLDSGFTLIVSDFAAQRQLSIDWAGENGEYAFLERALITWNQDLNPFSTGHLRLRQAGADTLLEVDRDGAGSAYAPVTLILFRDAAASAFTATNLGGYAADGRTPDGFTIIGDKSVQANDELRGLIGDDLIDGRTGDDRLYGDAGADHILGGDGSDQIEGGLGGDLIEGGAGNDTIRAQGGNDLVYGGEGNDIISDSGRGRDHLYGEGGNDRLVIYREDQFNPAPDTIDAFGGDGDDEIEIGFRDKSVARVDAGTGADLVFIGQLAGTALVTLGDGADLVRIGENNWPYFRERPNLTILDFNTAPDGDRFVLDPGFLRHVIDGWHHGPPVDANPFAGGQLRLVQNGGDTQLVLDDWRGSHILATFSKVNAATFGAQTLGGFDPLRVFGTAGDDVLMGTSGNNTFDGGAGADFIDLGGGGDDAAIGGAGNDGFYMGGALSAGDRLDGGDGTLDQLALQGGYAGFTFGAAHLTGIEQLVLLPGNDTRFGDMSGAVYSYDLITTDANVAAGQRLVVTFNTLRAGENVTFNGAAEKDGYFLTYGGLGIDLLTGGQKDDGFFFGTGRFGAGDRVDGQGGTFDQLGLQGDFAGANKVVFGADQLTGIEFIVALSGGDARFGSGGAGYSYDLTTNDGNVAAGATMIVSANTLLADETLTFDGSAETNGRFRIFSGAGADKINGGAGDDQISGGRGADTLNGGGGADVFVYTAAADSTGAGFDRIVGFDYRVDKIDLPVAVGNFSDAIEASISAATFDVDLAAALNGVLGAGEAAAIQVTGGDMIGRFFGIVDANGIAGYQAGEDFVVEFVAPVTPPDPTIDFLI